MSSRDSTPIVKKAYRTIKNMLLTVVASIVVIYLLLCMLLYLTQERLIFFPEVLAPDFEYNFPHHFEEITWQVDGATINALHFKADNPRGAILYFRGNAGSLRSWGAIAADFIKHGYDVLIPDYRGYGKSTSKITNERMLHEDALFAYTYLQQHYPENQIIVYGRSLGTGLAVRLAASKKPRMLILETPYFSVKDIARRQFPFIPGLLLKYPLSTDLWISDVSCPIYLFHGTRDEFIPYNSSVQLLPLIKTEHELFTIQGGGHNNLGDFTQYHENLECILR